MGFGIGMARLKGTSQKIGDMVRKWREMTDTSERRAAEMLRTTQLKLHNIEKGTGPCMKQEILGNISRATGYTVDELCFLEREIAPDVKRILLERMYILPKVVRALKKVPEPKLREIIEQHTPEILPGKLLRRKG